MRIIKKHYLHDTLFVFTFAIFITACQDEQSNTSVPVKEINENARQDKSLVFDKLVGTWLSEDGKSFEKWSSNNNGTYRSVVFSVKGADTSWNEQANIYRENDKWVFENTVKGQNDGKPVKFLSSFLTENSVQFSNPEHDFPTDINYTVQNNNTVNAFIVGTNNKGGKDTIPFNYKKVSE